MFLDSIRVSVDPAAFEIFEMLIWFQKDNNYVTGFRCGKYYFNGRIEYDYSYWRNPVYWASSDSIKLYDMFIDKCYFCPVSGGRLLAG